MATADFNSMLLVLRLVSEGVGVAAELAKLAKRVAAGETITDAEIDAARQEVIQSVSAFDEAVAERTTPATMRDTPTT